MVGPVVAACRRDQPGVRVGLVAGHLVGLAITRHIIALPPLAETEVDHLVACVGPTVQRYLTGELPIAR